MSRRSLKGIRIAAKPEELKAVSVTVRLHRGALAWMKLLSDDKDESKARIIELALEAYAREHLHPILFEREFLAQQITEAKAKKEKLLKSGMSEQAYQRRLADLERKLARISPDGC